MTYRSLSFLLAGMLLVGCATSRTDLNVPLTVTNRSELPRGMEIAEGGVPLPLGALRDERALRIVDSAGRPVPAQFTVLNRWPTDGSIRWVLAKFPAGMAGGETLDYTLTTARGPRATPEHRIRVSEEDGGYLVDTGTMRFTVGTSNFALFDRVFLLDGDREIPLAGPGAGGDGFVIDAGERGTFSTRNDPEPTVRIEDAGPLRTTLLVEGKHKNEQGEPLLDYQVRIYAYAGSRAVRVQYVFTNRDGEWPDEQITLRNVSVNLSMAGDEEPSARWLIGPEGRQEIAPGERGRLDSCEVRHYEGPAVAGVARDDGLGIESTVQWFWQLRPKSIEATRAGTTVNLINAPEPGEPVYFYPGMSKTHDLLFRFTGPGRSTDDEHTARQFQQRLFVKCEPSWYCQETLALGRLVSADYPGYRPQFRDVQRVIEDGFREQVELIRELRKEVIDPERDLDKHHVIHFGDGYRTVRRAGDHRGILWDNCYYSYTHLLAMQYCRSGEDLFLDTLREAATFEGDITITWHDNNPGAPRINPGAYHIGGFSGWRQFTSSTYNFYKPIGMLGLFYLTGDRRHQEAGLLNLEWMLRTEGYDMLNNPRSCGAGLRAAVHGYLATGNKDYLYLARRVARHAIGMQKTYGHFAPIRNSIFMAPNALEGLCIYHELTGDERLGEILPEMVKSDFGRFRRPSTINVTFMNFYAAWLAGDEGHLETISEGIAGREEFGLMRGRSAVKDFAARNRPVPLMMWYMTDLASKPTPWAGTITLDPFPADTVACPAVRTTPPLDGTPGTGVWGDAPEMTLVSIPNPRRELAAETTIRVVHDLEYLYIEVDAAEPKMDDLRVTVTEPGGRVFSDDCVEIYVGPIPRRHCLKLMVNASGVVATGARGADRGEYDVPDPSQIRTAAGHRDDGWTLHVAVPLDQLGLDEAPRAGMELGFNVVRFRRPESFEMSTWVGTINQSHSTGTLVLE